MFDTFDTERLNDLQPDDISDSPERGSIVYFPDSPVTLSPADDLAFLRQELPDLLRLKNIGYHPESDRIPGLGNVDSAVAERVKRILVSVSDNIAAVFAPFRNEAETWILMPVTNLYTSMPAPTAPLKILRQAALSR